MRILPQLEKNLNSLLHLLPTVCVVLWPGNLLTPALQTLGSLWMVQLENKTLQTPPPTTKACVDQMSLLPLLCVLDIPTGSASADLLSGRYPQQVEDGGVLSVCSSPLNAVGED